MNDYSGGQDSAFMTSSSIKHSALDLICLNYENLDHDYLSRLFGAGGSGGESVGLAGTESSPTNSGQPYQGTDSTVSSSGGVINSLNILGFSHDRSDSSEPHFSPSIDANRDLVDAWIMDADLPEDLVVFGDSYDIGLAFLNRRFSMDISYSIKSLMDSTTSSIFRQALVFEHIGNVMIDLSRKSQLKNNSDNNIKFKGFMNDNIDHETNKDGSLIDETKIKDNSHFAADALMCAIRVLEKQSRDKLEQAAVEPIISLLLNIMKGESENQYDDIEIKSRKKKNQNGKKTGISKDYLQYIRSLLCNCMLSLDALIGSSTNEVVSEKDKEANLKLCLTCTYGLLCLGLYTNSSADITVAMTNLLAISTVCEEIKDNLALKRSSVESALDIGGEDDIETSTAKNLISSVISKPDSGKTEIMEKVSFHNKQKMGEDPVSNGAAKRSFNAKVNNQQEVVADFPHQINDADLLRSPRNQIPRTHEMQDRKKKWEKLPAPNFLSEPAAKVVIDKDSKCKIQMVKSGYNFSPRESYDRNITIMNVASNHELKIDSPQFHQKQQSSSIKTIKPGPVGVKARNNISDDRPPGKYSSKNAVDQNPKHRQQDENVKQNRSKKRNKKLGQTVRNLLRVPENVLQTILSLKNSSMHMPSAENILSNQQKSQTDKRSYVWTTGQNSYGELGHCDAMQRKNFAEVAYLENKCIASIGAGNEHSVFVDTSGKVYVCGYNENGQCGLGTTVQARQLSQVQTLENEFISKIHIYNGCEHTLAVTKEGKLYSFGYNYRGQLGLGNTNTESSPKLVRSLMSRRVILCASSYHHSLILCSDGGLFSFGRNDCGQLGHGDSIDKKTPQLVANSPKEVVTMSCGQFHTILSVGSGAAYACGKNDYGQLGLDVTEVVRIFTKLPAFSEGNLVQQVCCGYYHTLVLLQNGVVTGFGRNDYGQLGLGHTQPRVSGYHAITSLRDKNVMSIAAGCYHSIVVTANGMLYVFGRNNHGQLGTGDLNERHIPHPIDNFIGKRISEVAAGFYHTIILATDLEDDIGSLEKINFPCNEMVEMVGKENNKTATLAAFALALQNSIGKDRHNQQSASNDIPTGQPKRNNIKEVFSINRLTKLTIRDLLPYLVKHLSVVINHSCVNSDENLELSISLSDADKNSSNWKRAIRDISWLARQIRSIAVLISISRQYALNSCLFLDVPLVLEDSLKLIIVMLKSCGILLSKYGTQIASLYHIGLKDSDEQRNTFETFGEMHANSQKILSAEDMMEQVHRSPSKMFKDDSCTPDIVGSLIRDSLDQLRDELICTYLFLSLDINNDDSSMNIGIVRGKEYGHQVASTTLNILVQHFDQLFPSSTIQCQFIVILGQAITIASDANIPSARSNFNGDLPDHSRCLHLFGRICDRYQGPKAAVKTFESPKDGLMILEYMILVYSDFSMSCLQSRLLSRQQANDTGRSSEIEYNKTVRSLEHCISNFMKCAAPLIYTYTSENEGEAALLKHGLKILKSIFSCSEIVLEFLLKRNLPDDLLSVFRYGTMLSSILPSMLVFSISFTNPTNCTQDLLPCIKRLIAKLQLLGKIDTNNSFSPDLPTSTDVAAGGSSEGVHAKKDSSTALQTWWLRLLKLAVIFHAKIDAMLICSSANLSSENKSESMSYETKANILAGKNKNKLAINGIVNHSIWNHFTCPAAIDSFINRTYVKTTTIRQSVRDVTNDLRQREMITDHTYRLLYNSSRSSKTISIVESIEQMLLDLVIHIDGTSLIEFWPSVFGSSQLERPASANRLHGKQGNKRLYRMWSSVVRWTKLIHSKRSQLCEKSGVKWVDILKTIHEIVSKCRELLLTSQVLVQYTISPLVLHHKNQRSSKAWAAFRRCSMIIICLIRWRACRRANVRLVGATIVDFVSTAVDHVTSSYTSVDPELTAERWNCIVRELNIGNIRLRRFVRAIQDINSLLRDVTHTTMQTDVLIILSVALRESRSIYFERGRATFAATSPVLCCSMKESTNKTVAIRNLENILVATFLDFCSNFQNNVSLATCNDLTHLATSVNLLHVLCISRGDLKRIIPKEIPPAKLAFLLLLLVDDASIEGHPSVDEKLSNSISGNLASNTTTKKNPRERSKAARRASNSIISLIQGLSVHISSESCSDSAIICNQLLSVHCTLISHFQGARLTGKRSTDLDPLGNVSVNGKDSFGKNNLKDTMNSKRRCQELISKPMEFCRTQEGFVVQGDKLLNNYKGMDFTLAMWLMPTKKYGARHSFVTGKISHNDAWPIVSIRNDGKIVIIYGHGNEFERMTSQVNVPLFVWTHIAVVTEPKKIKLFINGVLDTQMNTKGNGRAILYPVVVGSCPQTLRTRVDHAREGFDGILAQYKYYTRALSPIHVRVVFDQGAPEKYDVKERWLYHLVASSRLLIHRCGNLISEEVLRPFATIMHMLFISDSSGRLRSSSLGTLQAILSLDVLRDISLTTNKFFDHNVPQRVASLPTENGPLELKTEIFNFTKTQSLNDAEFMPHECKTFKHRVVLYFLRLMGACWSPVLHTMANDSKFSRDLSEKVPSISSEVPDVMNSEDLESHNASHEINVDELPCTSQDEYKYNDTENYEKVFHLFLECAPAFLSECATRPSSPFSLPLSMNEMAEKLTPREETCNEMCALICTILCKLAKSPNWASVIEETIQQSSVRFCSGVPTDTGKQSATSIYSPILLDILGISILLGDNACGTYIGSSVNSYFSDARCQVLNINKTTGYVTILTQNNSGTNSQVSLVKKSELSGRLSKITSINPSIDIVSAVLKILNSLKVYIPLITNDALALNKANHPYLRQTLLRSLRPIEGLIYCQLLRYVTHPSVLDLPKLMSLEAFQELAKTFQQSACSLQCTPDHLDTPLLRGVEENDMKQLSLLKLWVRSSKYIITIPDSVVQWKFPAIEGERSFLDFYTSNMGVAPEVLHTPSSERLLKEGRLLDMVQAVAVFSSITGPGENLCVDQMNLYSMPSINLDDEKEIKKFQVSDWLGVAKDTGRSSDKTSRILPNYSANEPNEVEALDILQIFILIRREIIACSRQFLNKIVISNNFTSLSKVPESVPQTDWRLSLWTVLLSSSSSNTGNQKSRAFQICSSLSFSCRLDFTQNLATALRYMAISMLQSSQTSKSKSCVLETTDMFKRLLHAVYIWMDLHEGGDDECDICVNLLKMLLPALSYVESVEVELHFLVLCQASLCRVVYCVLNGKEMWQDLSELMKGNNFTLLRARAQDYLDKFKGKFNVHDENIMGYHLTQLVVTMEILQRYSIFPPNLSSMTRSNSPDKRDHITSQNYPQDLESSMSSSSENYNILPQLPVPDAKDLITCSPCIVHVRAQSVDVNLESCMLLGDLSSGSPSLKTSVVIEVSLGVNVPGQETIYETVYYGTALRFVQSGLVPGCSYSIRCRIQKQHAQDKSGEYLDKSHVFGWSDPVAFRTESTVPFTFDTSRRGADILISDDGLTASYAGDDCWSTVLGSRSFSAGVARWEIQIQQSSTAYTFVGVANSQADLNSFLGGCRNGWGFIGEQSLYHNREKVKVYGEPFSAGDVIGVILDLDKGNLSFCRNGKMLGHAFSNIKGELFPAVAFYNMGQEMEIKCEGFSASMPVEPIPCSAFRYNLNDISLTTELLYCINARAQFPSHLQHLIAVHCNNWCSGLQRIFQMVSGRYVILDQRSPMLTEFGLVAGERVRTSLGVAVVAGTAYKRIWFSVPHGEDHKPKVWFFSRDQITRGRDKGMFLRCSYESSRKMNEESMDEIPLSSTSDASIEINRNNHSTHGNSTPGIEFIISDVNAPDTSGSVTTPSALNITRDSSSPQQRIVINKELGSNKKTSDHGTLAFDVRDIGELANSAYWSAEMDTILIGFLSEEANNTQSGSIWDVPTDRVDEEFRTLQQGLSRIVMRNEKVSAKWGFRGPKRRAVIARLGVLRALNFLLQQYSDVLLPQRGSNLKFMNGREKDSDSNFPEDCDPTLISLGKSMRNIEVGVEETATSTHKLSSHEKYKNQNDKLADKLRWPLISPSWAPINTNRASSIDPLSAARARVFPHIKMQYFQDCIHQTASRPSKTDDDYDYPEDLPQIKINRIRSFRAREAAELLGIPGEELMQNSMFYQLWKELRSQTAEKLRMSYTHPMDDGQSRAFKIRFDGEGVDDYGGPYREIFQQICDELTSPDPSAAYERKIDANKNSVVSGDVISHTNGQHRPSSWGDMINKAHTEPTSNPHMQSEQSSDTHATQFSETNEPDRCFLPLLIPTANWAAGESEERYSYILNPASTSALRTDLYRFMGQLVGIAVRSRLSVDLPLPSIFWKSLVRETLSENDLASFDVSAADFVSHLAMMHQRLLTAQATDNAVDLAKAKEDAFGFVQDLTWTATRTDGAVVELVTGGASKHVTVEDIPSYLSAYIHKRLTESYEPTEAFRNGFTSIVPESGFSLMGWRELKDQVCGSSYIDIDRLHDNTEYDEDISENDDYILRFWGVLRSFSEEEKSAFLRFVWARPSLPPKEVPFPQKFKIQGGVGDDAQSSADNYLPRAHTCFFSVNLPKYSSKEVMAEKLRYAMFNCTEMDADFRITESAVVGWGAAIQSPSSSRNPLMSEE